MSPLVWAGIGLLGGLGAVARDFVTAHLGLWAVNLGGTFALGVLVGAGVGVDGMRLAATGFLAAFTTFSALTLESRRRGAMQLALGLLAIWLGRTIA